MGLPDDVFVEEINRPYGEIEINKGLRWGRCFTINHNKVDDDLEDFPVLVKLDSSNFDFSHVNSDGSDIRFYDSDGNLIPHEIESWDSDNKTAEIWVKIPNISKDEDTEFCMKYGNSLMGAGDYSPEDVWDDEFIAVHHMAGEAPFIDPVVFFEDDISEWTAWGSGVGGTLKAPVMTADSAEKKSGNNSMKIVCEAGGTFTRWHVRRDFATPQDWSDKTGIAFWWYGFSDGKKHYMTIYTGGGTGYYNTRFIYDRWVGWRLVYIPFAMMGTWGTPDLSDVTAFYFGSDTNNQATTGIRFDLWSADKIPDLLDSTSYGHDITQVGAPEEIDGVIDKGQYFNYYPDYTYRPLATPELECSYITLEFWMRYDSGGMYGGFAGNFDLGNVSGFQTRTQWNDFRFLCYIGGAWRHLNTGGYPDAEWHHYTCVYDGEYMRVYRDTIEIGTAINIVGTIAYNVNCFWHLGRGIFSRYIYAGMDEVRLSKVGRSLAWIKANYESVNNSLITVGSEFENLAPDESEIEEIDRPYGEIEEIDRPHGEIEEIDRPWGEIEKI